MVKRRVRVPLAILERPLMSDTDFLVDARYRKLKLIGAGSYGIVVSAIDSVTDERVAIKKILNAFASSRMARNVLREVRLLRHLHHPNIVQLLDIDVPSLYEAWDEVYIVTPLLKTDLRDKMNNEGVHDERTKKKIAYQMLMALRHMHSLGLMHRDVKSRNLLLDQDNNVQLCDLGHARFYSGIPADQRRVHGTRQPELTGGVSTIVQSAPELALGMPYDAEVDIWAAACVIAELLHKEHRMMFDTTQRGGHVQEIIDIVGYPDQDMANDLPDFGKWYLKRQKTTKAGHNRVGEMLGDDVDAKAVDLMKKMLQFSPKNRLSAEAALKHEWFDEVRDEEEKRVEGKYEFSKTEPARKTNKGVLKRMVWEEVVAFHPEMNGVR